jgi:hypothetical protein
LKCYICRIVIIKNASDYPGGPNVGQGTIGRGLQQGMNLGVPNLGTNIGSNFRE